MWNIKIVNRVVVQVQNCLEECETCVPVANNSKLTLIELCHLCKSSKHPVAKDLLSILTKLHFKVSNEYDYFLFMFLCKCMYFLLITIFFVLLRFF